MYLSSLQLKNFRNYKDFESSFTNGLIILTGQNASGKTNLLEAVELLSLSKSFRARSEYDLILFGMDFAKILGTSQKNNHQTKLDITIDSLTSKNQKVIKIDGLKSRAFDLIGELVTVLFSPEDLNLVNSAPQLRRRYLDVVICQINKDYCRNLSEYKKVLINRNQLLANIKDGYAKKEELSFWNEKLIDLGTRIIIERQKTLQFFNTKLSEIYNDICDTKDQKLRIIYLPNLPLLKDSDIKKLFEQELNNKYEREIYKTYTLVGPHRDNFVFELNKKRLAIFGSRGEYRSAILALKSAELDFIEQSLGERPILLLDDVFSELDEKRRNHMFDLVRRQQTFITSADFVGLEVGFVRDAQVLQIKNGEITNK
ncbi:MAG: DNA replication/repair protein RecF [Patescibacteria group bacterium]|jgi:DNA replication and repair protein RecF